MALNLAQTTVRWTSIDVLNRWLWVRSGSLLRRPLEGQRGCHCPMRGKRMKNALIPCGGRPASVRNHAVCALPVSSPATQYRTAIGPVRSSDSLGSDPIIRARFTGESRRDVPRHGAAVR